MVRQSYFPQFLRPDVNIALAGRLRIRRETVGEPANSVSVVLICVSVRPAMDSFEDTLSAALVKPQSRVMDCAVSLALDRLSCFPKSSAEA